MFLCEGRSKSIESVIGSVVHQVFEMALSPLLALRLQQESSIFFLSNFEKVAKSLTVHLLRPWKVAGVLFIMLWICSPRDLRKTL